MGMRPHTHTHTIVVRSLTRVILREAQITFLEHDQLVNQPTPDHVNYDLCDELVMCQERN